MVKQVNSLTPQTPGPVGEQPKVSTTEEEIRHTPRGRSVRKAFADGWKSFVSSVKSLARPLSRPLSRRSGRIHPTPPSHLSSLKTTDISNPRSAHIQWALETLTAKGYSTWETGEITAAATRLYPDSIVEFNAHIHAQPYVDGRQPEFEHTVHKLRRKGYPPQAAIETAHTAMQWSQVTGGKVSKYLRKVPKREATGQARVQLYCQAINSLKKKGYSETDARNITLQIMDEYGGNPAKAKKEIVKQLYRKPTDTGEHRKDLQKKFVTTTIKPWIADTLRTGGATPAEAEADAEQLIKGAGGYRNGNIFLMVSGTEAFQARNRRAVDEPNKMSRKEALKVLNLPSSATPAEIKKAFAKIARENHGDKLDQDDPVKEQTMRQAQIAYEQLTKGN